MTGITLREVSGADWRRCAALHVAPDQKLYVSSNAYSLLQAKYEPQHQWMPLAAYDGEKMVGFVMYGRPQWKPKLWFILRLMIDRNLQGQGYGRAIMEALIDRLSAEPDCREIHLSYHPDNDVAARLYASLGFQLTGQMTRGGELVAKLSVEREK